MHKLEVMKYKSHVLQLDVNSGPSIATAAEAVFALTNGKLDFLVNNSGVSYYTPILDTEIERESATFETNVVSWVAMVKAFFPLLRAAKGSILNNASSGGCDASYLPFGGISNSSKSSAAKLSQTMRLEFAPFDVKVITLYAGGLETNIWNNMGATEVNTLRKDSLYQPIKTEATNIMSGDFIKNSAVGPWAEDVVAKATSRNQPIEIWNGAMSSTIWRLNFLAPRWLVDMAFNDQCGLKKLRQRLPPETQ
ncbi:hypothetical protein LTR37_005387 [Vermiconidia calcicola]|uniref:Uncharacterized protein n=1 Tax=Vermiconidia calcicola TaxID=1690605 RepID=A0ACC3NIZ7_9PEZI|nr:hypothetical protein LTR37_005387 [Vermiconidia calcicola]